MSSQESPHQRYLKGLELYKAGAVKLEDDGWRVDGHMVAVGYPPYQCTCPDYQKGIVPCTHIYAAREFVKNSGNEKINEK